MRTFMCVTLTALLASDGVSWRAGQQVHAGDEGDAREPEPRRLADVQPDLRRAAVQPAQTDHSPECRPVEGRVDGRARHGDGREHPARLSRRHVRHPAGGWRARAGRDDRRDDLGVQAGRQRAPEDAGDLRRSRLLHRARQHARRARRAHRRGAMGNEDGRRLDVGADRRRGEGADGTHVLAPAGELLRRGPRRQDRQGDLEVLHRGGRRRSRREDMGRCAGGDARGFDVGTSRRLRSGEASGLLGHRQSRRRIREP